MRLHSNFGSNMTYMLLECIHLMVVQTTIARHTLLFLFASIE